MSTTASNKMHGELSDIPEVKNALVKVKRLSAPILPAQVFPNRSCEFHCMVIASPSPLGPWQVKSPEEIRKKNFDQKLEKSNPQLLARALNFTSRW